MSEASTAASDYVDISADELKRQRDENDPGEVPTSFATKGQGWSGRDDDDDDSLA